MYTTVLYRLKMAGMYTVLTVNSPRRYLRVLFAPRASAQTPITTYYIIVLKQRYFLA